MTPTPLPRASLAALVVLVALPLALAAGLRPAAQAASTHTPAPVETMKKLSPLITVDAVEPCLPFWTDRLGFEVTVTVPHEDAMGFAILAKGGVEVMYQSRASVEADIPALADELHGQRTALFIEVEGDLDWVVEALEGADVVVPRRETFYGMDEIFVRAPCGTVVGFASPTGDAGDAPD